jgi:ubiquinone/menaquinone biosynthesis C-methylase UbiE
MSNRFEDLINAPSGERQRIAERLYDDYSNKRVELKSLPPSKRRQKRIAIYRKIIGANHERILELGCGAGDLSYNLVGDAERIVATDISQHDIEFARQRSSFWRLGRDDLSRIEFRQMSAVQLDLPDDRFNWAISTSMIEHLHPDDVNRHLRELHRVLQSGGSYLIWCPNRLGHHDNREGHLTMLSYRQWIDKLRSSGFRRFRSTLTARSPLVGAGWKVLLETVLSRTGVKIMWSHLGVRNVLLVATK